MDYLPIMRVDPHTFAENFIAEDYFKSQARARGVELGTVDTTPGAGAFLRYLASTLKAQSVVEVGTGIVRRLSARRSRRARMSPCPG